MSDHLTEEEFDAIELECENALATLESIDLLERSVVDSSQVDRATMESLQRLVPESIDKNYPLVTYTISPSEQNYQIALESFSVAKAVAIAAVGGLLGAILFQLIKAFRSNKVDVRADYLNKKKDELKNNERELKSVLTRVRKLNLNTEDRLTIDAIESWNLDVLLSPANRADGKVTTFLRDVTPGGKVYRIMDRWSSDIVKRSSEFKKRVRTLAEVVQVMYDVRGSEIANLQKKADSIVLDDKDRFLDDLTTVNLFFQGLGLEGKFSEFIDEDVVGTTEFRDLLTNTSDLLAYDKLYSNASVQIQKNLKEIEDKYAPVLQGQARENAEKKSRASARATTITSTDDEVVVTQDGAAGGINPMLLRSVRMAEQSLRKEASSLKSYVTFLERIMFFYQKAVVERERVEHKAMKLLMDIENRAQ